MLLALVMVCGTGCPPDYVFFADDALESAIRAEIGKPLGFLTAGDLLDVFTLDARNLNIRYLNGLERCTNLEWVDLSGNQIADLRVFEDLRNPLDPLESPVVYLNLNSNEITDITPLAGMLNLSGVLLFDNQVADLGPLVTNAELGGLGEGDYVVVDFNTLNEEALNVDIPTLQGFGVNVTQAVPAK